MSLGEPAATWSGGSISTSPQHQFLKSFGFMHPGYGLDYNCPGITMGDEASGFPEEGQQSGSQGWWLGTQW